MYCVEKGLGDGLGKAQGKSDKGKGMEVRIDVKDRIDETFQLVLIRLKS